VVSAKERAAPDWAVVTAIGSRTPDSLRGALSQPEARDAIRVLVDWADSGAQIAAASAWP
jgi:hypothetical protein